MGSLVEHLHISMVIYASNSWRNESLARKPVQLIHTNRSSEDRYVEEDTQKCFSVTSKNFGEELGLLLNKKWTSSKLSKDPRKLGSEINVKDEECLRHIICPYRKTKI